MEKDTRMLPAEKPRAGEKEIYLAGGCFWGTEHFMSKVAGVRVSESGYANGTVANPTYEDVCTGRTGAAETVHVIYDPEKLICHSFSVSSLKPLIRQALTARGMTSEPSTGPAFFIPIQAINPSLRMR